MRPRWPASPAGQASCPGRGAPRFRRRRRPSFPSSTQSGAVLSPVSHALRAPVAHAGRRRRRGARLAAGLPGKGAAAVRSRSADGADRPVAAARKRSGLAAGPGAAARRHGPGQAAHHGAGAEARRPRRHRRRRGASARRHRAGSRRAQPSPVQGPLLMAARPKALRPAAARCRPRSRPRRRSRRRSTRAGPASRSSARRRTRDGKRRRKVPRAGRRAPAPRHPAKQDQPGPPGQAAARPRPARRPRTARRHGTRQAGPQGRADRPGTATRQPRAAPAPAPGPPRPPPRPGARRHRPRGRRPRTAVTVGPCRRPRVSALWDTPGRAGTGVLARPVSAATRARDVRCVLVIAGGDPARHEPQPKPSRAAVLRRIARRSACERQRRRLDAGGGRGRPPRPGCRGRADRPGPRDHRRRRPRARPAAHPRGRARRAPRVRRRTSRTSTDEDLRGFYRDLVLIRRVDAEATALQRQGELGIWASLLGQEAAQVGSGRALRAAGLRLPDLPRARRRLVPRGRPAQPARPVPRRQPRRLGPEREELPPLHDRHRRPDAARHRLRDGHPARRRRRHRRPRPRRRRHRLLRRRRDQPGRRQRGVRLRRGQQRPGRVLLPEQPVGHLRAQRAADPHPALPARPRLRLPRRAGRRQRRARGLRRDQGGARRTPAPGKGPTFVEAFTYRMGAHTTSDDPTKYRVSAEVEMWKHARPDRAAARPTWRTQGKADQAFFDARRARGRRAGRARPCRAAWRCPTRRRSSMFDHIYVEEHPLRRGQERAEFAAYHASFEGEGSH